jgi:hypothetical protein
VNGLIGLAAILAAIALYMLPTIVAQQREAPNLGSAAVVNVFLAWMVAGWVVALAMASRTRAAAPTATAAPNPLFAAPCARCGLPRAAHANGRCLS